MTSSNDRLERLVRQATRSLRSLTGRSAAITSVPVSHAGPSSASRLAGVSGLAAKSINGVPLLDDERQIRALAKEIKRLIAEDSRRGLRV